MLTDEDREALLVPCECGHTINDHGSICWMCEDNDDACNRDFESLLVERLDHIVARHVAAALRHAQSAIAGEDTVEWARTATRSHISLSYAMELLDDLIEDAAAPPP